MWRETRGCKTRRPRRSEGGPPGELKAESREGGGMRGKEGGRTEGKE